MSLKCPACQREVLPSSRFCPYCSAALAGKITVGSTLDGGIYRIQRSLSKGGMGAVYLARDGRAFDRLCVVKQMLDYYDAANPEERDRAQRRFEEEGRTLSMLSHSGIPRIYAFFVEAGRYYIVMEYIRGPNLESFVTQINPDGVAIPPVRTLPREDVIRYAIQACRILEYLHGLPRPVIHQDVKPANLILDDQAGEVRLVDFGTARQNIPPDALHGAPASIYGTEGYAPPEQYQGKAVPRSDVFSLAVTLYQLLTDDDPRMHPFQYPKLGQMPREISQALERALKPDPNERSHARQLRQALELFATPNRQVETFTFPGGAQIRSVATLAPLSDEHWEAAKSFMYHGDYQRWLRDLNRLDLVLAANEIVQAVPDQDAGLEQFLRVVDTGLTRPHTVADPAQLDFGRVAREAGISRYVELINTTRGYTRAQISVNQPWLEVFPTELPIAVQAPAKLRVAVHAEALPLRQEQHGQVRITLPDQEPLTISVTVRVSILRELWRISWRALSSAIPEAYRTTGGLLSGYERIRSTLARPFVRWPWLHLLWYLVLAALIVTGLYYLPADRQLVTHWVSLAHPEAWYGYILPALLGPLLIAAAVVIVPWLLLLVGGLLVGFIKGAWRSFVR